MSIVKVIRIYIWTNCSLLRIIRNMPNKLSQEILKPYNQFSARLPTEMTKHLSKSMWHWSNGRNGHGQLSHLQKMHPKSQSKRGEKF